METYNFKIADFAFQIQTDWPVWLEENYRPFLSGAPWQERLRLRCVEEFPATPEPSDWNHGMGETVCGGKKCILYRLGDHLPPYLMELCEADNDRVFCYRKSSNELPLSMAKVFSNISLETLFLRHGILLLHSSFIRWNGKAILFSAPSGTGKSTQADLWEKYQGADILNGDRSALRKVNGQWTAFGLPYAGSSDIFRNESAPIDTIVMLSQGPENVISPLDPAQALRKIFPEVTLHHWDRQFLEKGLDLILDLLNSVSVYHLSCLPDKGAVDLLHDTMIHKE